MEYNLNLSKDSEEEVHKQIKEQYDDQAIPPDPEIIRTYEVTKKQNLT